MPENILSKPTLLFPNPTHQLIPVNMLFRESNPLRVDPSYEYHMKTSICEMKYSLHAKHALADRLTVTLRLQPGVVTYWLYVTLWAVVMATPMSTTEGSMHFHRAATSMYCILLVYSKWRNNLLCGNLHYTYLLKAQLVVWQSALHLCTESTTYVAICIYTHALKAQLVWQSAFTDMYWRHNLLYGNLYYTCIEGTIRVAICIIHID